MCDQNTKTNVVRSDGSAETKTNVHDSNGMRPRSHIHCVSPPESLPDDVNDGTGHPKDVISTRHNTARVENIRFYLLFIVSIFRENDLEIRLDSDRRTRAKSMDGTATKDLLTAASHGLRP